MCGIAAHFRFGGRATALDLRLIAHRGPDASGEWISPDGRFWLGNTRLAILDLSPTGAQPMVDPATGNVIVVNGEIYNHRALRAEMGDVAWRGTSDTETLLQGYARWGRRSRSAEGNVRFRHLRSRARGTFRRARSPRNQAALLFGRGQRHPLRLRDKRPDRKLRLKSRAHRSRPICNGAPARRIEFFFRRSRFFPPAMP